MGIQAGFLGWRLRLVPTVKRQVDITQFLAESVIMSIFALILAGFLTFLALPYFNTLAGKELAVDFLSDWILGLSVFITIILVGLLAGSYPAFMLSPLFLA